MFGAILLQRWTKANFSRLVARKDVDAVMRGWSEDGVFEMPGTSTMSGRFEGKAAIKAWVAEWFDSMATIDFTVKRVALTDTLALSFRTNDVMIEWEVREPRIAEPAFALEVSRSGSFGEESSPRPAITSSTRAS